MQPRGEAARSFVSTSYEPMHRDEPEPCHFSSVQSEWSIVDSLVSLDELKVFDPEFRVFKLVEPEICDELNCHLNSQLLANAPQSCLKTTFPRLSMLGDRDIPCPGTDIFSCCSLLNQHLTGAIKYENVN